MCGSHCSDTYGTSPVDSHRRVVLHTLLAIAIAKAKALNHHREFRSLLIAKITSCLSPSAN